MISAMSDWLLCEPFQQTVRSPSKALREGRRSAEMGGDMANTRMLTGSSSKRRKPDEIEFRLIFMVSFVFFLIAAALTRCLPRKWRLIPPGPDGKRSIIREAKIAAGSTIPFAFMG